jgi:hypothetical protein
LSGWRRSRKTKANSAVSFFAAVRSLVNFSRTKGSLGISYSGQPGLRRPLVRHRLWGIRYIQRIPARAIPVRHGIAAR